MDRKPLLWIMAGVVALVAGWQLASAQGKKEKAVQKWEYKSSVQEPSGAESRLNAAGKAGWELIAITGEGRNPAHVFKRPM